MFAFDLDETVWSGPTRQDGTPVNEDPSAYTLNEEVASLLHSLHSQGGVAAYVTGRRVATLTSTALPLLRRFSLPSLPVYCQREWLGWREMVNVKAAALGACGATVYVGDLKLDEQAARDAECGFLYAQDIGKEKSL